MPSTKHDVVIVGGGTAGLVLAARLSENPDVHVFVLEAGRDQSTDSRVITPALWPMLLGTDADWAYRTIPQPELGDREIVFPQGRLLGGSSALNGLAFVATSKSNVDAWAALGNLGWEWSTVSKYFKKSYTLTRPLEAAVKHLSLDYIDENVRGTDGPLHLSFPDEPDNVWAKAWVDTLTGLGFPNPATRQRSYSANAYLQPAKTRPNLTVITGALVDKIVLDNSNSNEVIATDVQYTKDGETKIVEAHKEVTISAGSFNSPRLLELSGIGNPEILKQHNVPVVIDNPNVGENLQNHLMCGMSFEVVEGIKTLDSLARQSPDTLAAASEAYAKGGGPFASSGTYASALLPFPNNNTAEGRRDLQQLLSSTTIQAKQNTETAAFVQAHQAFVQSVLSSPVEGTACYISFPGYASFNPDGSMAPPPQGPENYFTIAVLLAHPLSRGSVHISSASPSAPVRIDPRYLSHSLDLEVIAHHVRFIENRIIHAEPLKGLLKSGGKRSTGAPASLEEIEVAKDYVRRAGLGAHHPTGSCSMMPREKGGVVDANLRVYGCRNLRVCDASIIPITPRANPHASVYAVAERAADLLKQ